MDLEEFKKTCKVGDVVWERWELTPREGGIYTDDLFLDTDGDTWGKNSNGEETYLNVRDLRKDGPDTKPGYIYVAEEDFTQALADIRKAVEAELGDQAISVRQLAEAIAACGTFTLKTAYDIAEPAIEKLYGGTVQLRGGEQ